jgi:hypothetical protein
VLRYVLMNHRIIDQQLGDREHVRGGDYVVDEAVREDEPELDEMYANIAFGTAEEVRAKIARYAELGVDQYSAWHNLGQPHAQVCASMTAFAREVMPEFHTAMGHASPGEPAPASGV